jgi:hypothetical protein
LGLARIEPYLLLGFSGFLGGDGFGFLLGGGGFGICFGHVTLLGRLGTCILLQNRRGKRGLRKRPLPLPAFAR